MTVNDAGVAAQVLETAAELLGAGQRVAMPAPLMGAEDFSYVLERGARRDGVPRRLPAAARPGDRAGQPLEPGVFDEEPLPAGVALYAQMALQRPRRLTSSASATGAARSRAWTAGRRPGRRPPGSEPPCRRPCSACPPTRSSSTRHGGAHAAAPRSPVLLHAFWPVARRRLGVVTPLLAGDRRWSLTPLSTESGEEPASTSVGETALVEQHAELADGLLPWVIGCSWSALALWLLDRASSRARRRPDVEPGPLGADRRRGADRVAVVGTVQQVVRVGHAGAEATWSVVVHRSAERTATRASPHAELRARGHPATPARLRWRGCRVGPLLGRGGLHVADLVLLDGLPDDRRGRARPSRPARPACGRRSTRRPRGSAAAAPGGCRRARTRRCPASCIPCGTYGAIRSGTARIQSDTATTGPCASGSREVT